MIPFYNSAPSKVFNEKPPIPEDVLSFLKLESSTTTSSSSQRPAKRNYAYDSSRLSSLTNLSSELLASVEDIGGSLGSDLLSSLDAGNAANALNASNMSREVKGGDTDDDGFLLAMIFKIVPIGINIVSRGRTIVQGFKELGTGIVDLIKNTAILTGIIGIDTIEFFFQLCAYLFKLLLCSVSIISDFPKCVIFYFIQLLINVVLACIVSILFIVDVFLMPKKWAGIGAVEIFIMILDIIENLDQVIYANLSFHIIHYPESIVKMCYTCSAMGDTSGFKRVANRWFNDIFVKIPNDIGGPIGESITGIGHIFSFLDLS